MVLSLCFSVFFKIYILLLLPSHTNALFFPFTLKEHHLKPPPHFLQPPILALWLQRQEKSPVILLSDCEATDYPVTRSCSAFYLGGYKQQEEEEQSTSAWRKLRSADVTFPRNQPVLGSPVIIHHFVYKWEIAFSCSVSSKRLKLI